MRLSLPGFNQAVAALRGVQFAPNPPNALRTATHPHPTVVTKDLIDCHRNRPLVTIPPGDRELVIGSDQGKPGVLNGYKLNSGELLIGGYGLTDFDEEEPLASWKAALLPDWEWEAYDKEDDGTYFGRVKSPNTYGRWEYGYFTQEQLETAAAYRTDLDPDDGEPLFPDGGVPGDLAQIYETELDALLDEAYREEYDDGEGD